MTSATIFPDTTILIQYQSLDQIDWRSMLGVNHVKIILSASIVQEVMDIRDQQISPNLAKRARATLQSIQQLVKNSGATSDSLIVEKAVPPSIDFSAEALNPNSISDLLVATIINYQRNHALEYVVMFSDDQETKEKAHAAGIEIARLPSRYLYQNAASQPAPKPVDEIIDDTPAQAPPMGFPASSPLFGTFLQKDSAPLYTSFESNGTPDGASTDSDSTLPELVEPYISESETRNIDDNLDREIDNDSTLPEGVGASFSDSNDSTDELEDPADASAPFLDIKQKPARPDRSQFINDSRLDAPESKQEPELPDETEEISPSKTASDSLPFSMSVTLPKVPSIEVNLSDGAVEPPAEEPEEIPPAAPLPPVISTPTFSFSNQKATKAPEPAKEPEEEVSKSELRLSFGNDESRSAIIIRHPEYPSIDEVASNIAALKEQYPKLNQLNTIGGDGIDNNLAMMNGSSGSHENKLIESRRNSRIKKYNAALESYYSNSEKFFGELAEFNNLRRRSAELDLMLVNELPDTLRNLYISIHFPGNMRVYSEDTLPDEPVGPYPPEEPDLDAIFDRLRLPAVPVPNEILASESSVKLRSRKLAPVEVRWNKGWDVIYSLKEVEQNEKITFNPLFIVFNSFEQATSFRIQFRITVASASYEERGDLEVLVRKEI